MYRSLAKLMLFSEIIIIIIIRSSALHLGTCFLELTVLLLDAPRCRHNALTLGLKTFYIRVLKATLVRCSACCSSLRSCAFSSLWRNKQTQQIVFFTLRGNSNESNLWRVFVPYWRKQIQCQKQQELR